MSASAVGQRRPPVSNNFVHGGQVRISCTCIVKKKNQYLSNYAIRLLKLINFLFFRACRWGNKPIAMQGLGSGAVIGTKSLNF